MASQNVKGALEVLHSCGLNSILGGRKDAFRKSNNLRNVPLSTYKGLYSYSYFINPAIYDDGAVRLDTLCSRLTLLVKKFVKKQK